MVHDRVTRGEAAIGPEGEVAVVVASDNCVGDRTSVMGGRRDAPDGVADLSVLRQLKAIGGIRERRGRRLMDPQHELVAARPRVAASPPRTGRRRLKVALATAKRQDVTVPSRAMKSSCGVGWAISRVRSAVTVSASHEIVAGGGGADESRAGSSWVEERLRQRTHWRGHGEGRLPLAFYVCGVAVA